MLDLVRRFEPDLSPENLLLSVPTGSRSDIKSPVRHLWRHDFTKKETKVSLANLGSLLMCPECEREENVPEIIQMIADPDLNLSVNELYWLEVLQPLSADRPEITTDQHASLYDIYSVVMEFDKFREYHYDQLTDILAKDNQAERYLPVIREQVERVVSDLNQAHVNMIGNANFANILAVFASQKFGVVRDDSEVLTVLDSWHKLRYKVSGVSSALHPNVMLAMALQVITGTDGEYDTLKLQRRPRWVVETLRSAAPEQVLSSSYPVEEVDQKVLETALSLWTGKTDEPYGSFDVAMEAAEKLLL